jgi:hypothetical protein
MKRELKRLEAAFEKYEGAIGALEAAISPKADFDFGILYQPGDGFVLADDDANNAPLDTCIEIIQKKGELTHEDYLNVTI